LSIRSIQDGVRLPLLVLVDVGMRDMRRVRIPSAFQLHSSCIPAAFQLHSICIPSGFHLHHSICIPAHGGPVPTLAASGIF
jgi:hypothetical protein